MKTNILFVLFVAVFLFSGCTKNEGEFDPDEVLVTVSTEGWITGGAKGYLVIENSESTALSASLVPGEKCILKRGENVIGDKINLHILSVIKNSQNQMTSWSIISFYEIAPGKEFKIADILNADGAAKGQNQTIRNVSFSDIPEFDIVTRSANNQGHCHTLNTLTVPCAYPGYDSFLSGNYFYVCMHKNGSAGYKILNIPETTLTNYVISLSGLNTNMTKHLIPKNPDYKQSVRVEAFSDEGSIDIFNMSSADETIFAGNNIEVFVPVGLSQMTSFATTYFKINNTRRQTGYHYGSAVVTDNSYLDAALSLTAVSGKLPEVSHTGADFDLLFSSVNFEDYRGSWELYYPDGKSIYVPDFPDDILLSVAPDFQLSSQVAKVDFIDATAIDDSRLDSYDDAVEYYLSVRVFPKDNYSVLSDRTGLILK